MSSSLFDASRNTPQNATASRGGGKSKPSMLKRLKKLVRGSPAGLPQPQPEASTSTFEHQRRAEALRTCGLLKQSVKYGAPYHDDEDDARTVISPSEQRWGQDTEDKKDLINFGEKISLEKESDLNSNGEKVKPVYTPTTPRPRLSVCTSSQCCGSDCASTIESDSSTLAPDRQPIRMRRIGSLAEEIEQIEDDESRRLTEVAFLS